MDDEFMKSLIRQTGTKSAEEAEDQYCSVLYRHHPAVRQLGRPFRPERAGRRPK